MLALLTVVLTATSPATLEHDFPHAKLFVRPGESTVSIAIGLDEKLSGAEGARAFLFKYGSAFGLQTEDELVLLSSRGDALLTALRFERRKAGVMVHGAELTVTFDRDGRLVMIHAGAQVPMAKGAFKLPAAYALEREPGATEATRAWVRSDGVLRPAWVVTRKLPEGPTVWVSVDAETGKVLERRRIAWTVDGLVFDISAVRSQAALCTQQPDAGYTPCATPSTRTLGNLAAGATSLSGPRVVARNCQGQQGGTGCLPRASPTSGNFVYAPDLTTSNMDRFGEVMAYYQADRFSAWLDSLSPPFQTAGGLGVVDVFTNVGGYEGGFFEQSGPFNRFGVRLGQGPLADWAYDADVLWHELGHGLVERTSQFGFYSRDSQGLFGDSGSLNEGSADCVSLAFKGSPQLGENAGSRLLEDGQTTAPYLRTIETKRMCQISSVDGTTLARGGRVGEIHADGVIWGSFFWELRQRLASVSTTGLCVNCNAAEIALTRSLESLGSSASFNDATLAVQQVMASVFGAQAAQLVGCMNCEWDMPACADRTREVFPNETHEALLIDSGSGSYNGVTPLTFQYALAVPANTTVNFNRFLIESGTLTILARFNSKVSWTSAGHNATHTITAQGNTLPSQATAGTWYLQGTHNGASIRKFGFRVNFVPSGNTTTRPAVTPVTCTLGGSFPSGCACTPQCAGKQCGSDGCGGTCGTCGSGQTCSLSSQCACTPSCTGKQCGADGCGGSCGTCPGGQVCTTAGACSCVPSCAGRACGSDGCGGSCGGCPSGQSCNNGLGQCVMGVNPCEGLDCGPDGQGGDCGTCPQDFTCTAQGSCSGSAVLCGNKLCGPDGVGGSCGTCDALETCTDTGTCIVTPEVMGGCGCTSASAGLQVVLGAWLLLRRRRGSASPA
jgi:hypothetical protein